jgi:uncharacterized membrane protein (UPF0127 family)
MEFVARNATRGTVLADRVAVADSHLRRMRGLLGTRTLPKGHALLLRPCRQVHSFFMRYALDLVFIDRHGRVLLTRADFAQNRISPLVRAADAVLELSAGALAETPTEPGDLLCIEPRADAARERIVDVAEEDSGRRR